MTLIVVHSSAHYPPDPSGSNASKVVDITGLLVFVGDFITDHFGKDIREYDLAHIVGTQSLETRSW